MNEVFTDGALFLVKFDALSERALPAHLVVSTLSNSVQLYVLNADDALGVRPLADIFRCGLILLFAFHN